jgi:hypothetical protein
VFQHRVFFKNLFQAGLDIRPDLQIPFGGQTFSGGDPDPDFFDRWLV